MEITKGMEIKDLALYLKKHKILILGDVHIGYEEALNKQGILVPRFQFSDIIKRLEKIVENLEIETVIINGDLKHEFGKISEQEWRETLKVLDFLSQHCKQIKIIRGNHDKIIGPIAEKRNVEIIDHFAIDNIYICHGNIIPKDLKFSASEKIIIGHEHPAISLHEGTRVEKYKCFLKGKYKEKELIVMPSFNLVTEGTDILQEKTLSPFLHQDISGFNVFIVSDKVYDFGKMKKLMKKN
jgi:hypothetical protein